MYAFKLLYLHPFNRFLNKYLNRKYPSFPCRWNSWSMYAFKHLYLHPFNRFPNKYLNRKYPYYYLAILLLSCPRTLH
ncbi:hypothetical protein BDZ91DRAFT_716289 [Kalaharituber pfeilii]|nr:hypothetical protein BDZ91DRAFT_716289 [Kalaharituber pfeilii]